jgi:hypothetical protein
LNFVPSMASNRGLDGVAIDAARTGIVGRHVDERDVVHARRRIGL